MTAPRPTPRRAGPGKAAAVLAFVYVAKFGHLGVVLPFLPPWIQGKGFGPVAIGVLLALPPLFKLATPWTWGRWADRLGRRRELLIVAAGLAAVALAAAIRAPHPWLFGGLIALYGFARSAIIPLVEATTLERAERDGFAYGPVRLWGSLAFIAVSLLYGATRGAVHPDVGLLLAAASLGVVALTALVAFPAATADDDAASAAGSETAAEPPDASPLSVPAVWRFFAAAALMQLSHGTYYTFYTIRLEELGYGGAAIGALWAVGVLAEVVLFTRLDGLVERFGSTRVMQVCMGLAALRWVVIGSTSTAALLVSVQLLHAATYAGFHVAAIRQAFRAFGPERRTTGQAMYSGWTYGLGMFAGSLLAGWLARSIGIENSFYVSAGIAVVAIVVLGRGYTREVAREGGIG